MRIAYFLFISLLFTSSAFAEDFYLPESANPKTYTVISDCYAHDDVTFYTKQGRVLGDYADWKGIKIFSDGCFSRVGSKYLYNGDYFSYWDNQGMNSIPVTVTPDTKTFRIASFQSGITLGIDKNYLYRGNTAFRVPTGFDVSKMRIVDLNYITDGKTLYYFGSADGSLMRIENIDIPTFHVWRSPSWTEFYIDKNGIYINTMQVPTKQRETDPKNVAYINTDDLIHYSQYDLGTMTESGGLYLYDKYRLYLPTSFPKVDIASFQVLPDYYSRDKYHLYSPTGKILSVIDVKSYEYIGNSVFRSHGKLYQGCQNEVGCDGYPLDGFDAKTFHKTYWGFSDKNGNYDNYLRPIVGENLREDIVPYDENQSYFHDKKNVYIQSLDWNGYRLLSESLMSSFMAFSGTSYAKDVHSCWFENAQFPCDAGSLSAIEAWFAKDKNNVYYQTKKIISTDPKTFEKLTATGGYNWIETTHYSVDKNHVYYDEHMIQDANPKTFSLMKDLQSKDDKHIYYAGWKVEGADYRTYTPLRYSFARDKNHFYFAGTILGAINKPKDVKIISRDTLEYNGKMKNYWCFSNKSDSSMCN